MNEHRHIIIEGEELYHYGVKGMKWKDHVYAVAEKAGDAIGTSAKKVAGAASAFAKKFGKKAHEMKERLTPAARVARGKTRAALKRAIKKPKEWFDKTGYKLRKKGKGTSGKSAAGEYVAKLRSERDSERRKKAAARAKAIVRAQTRKKRNEPITKLVKGTAAAGRRMDRIRNESIRDTQNRNDINSLKKLAKSHVIANNEVSKYNRQDTTRRTGPSSAERSKLRGRINQRVTNMVKSKAKNNNPNVR